jgi:amino-acid N-acetyltransferase
MTEARTASLPSSLRFRKATPADVEPILSLLRAANLPPQGVKEHLPAFVVAENAGKVLAVAGFERYGTLALFRSVAVHDSHRGSGVGRAICKEALGRVAAEGVEHCYLLTETAPRFFERLGFRPLPRDVAPPAIEASEEFSSLCPASATFMHRTVG